MTKNNKLANELMSVDPPAGKLRLAILIVLLFIAWSLCAITVSISNPFSSLPDWLSLDLQSDANLASGVLDDILNSYFSFYALVYLLLFITCILAALLLIEHFISTLDSNIKAKEVGKHLRSCAFSIPAYPQINLEETPKTRYEHIGLENILGGPAYLDINPGLSVLLKDNNGTVRLVQSTPPDEYLFLKHQERINNIFFQEDTLTIRKFTAFCKDGSRIAINNLRLSLSLRDNPHEDNAQKQQTLQEAASIFRGTQWKTMFDRLLKDEVRTVFLNYTKAEIQRNLLEPAQNPKQPIPPTVHSNKTHGNPKHGKLYAIPGGFFHSSGSSIILRNRRRSLQPELRIYEDVEMDTLVEEHPDFIAGLSEWLTQSVNTIFSNQILVIKIEKIGRVTFDAIY